MSEIMEAKVLKKKRTTISKGQIKKTIKNVICKPDPIFWPSISVEEGKQLEAILVKYHIDIPPFKKVHWNEIKNMPKNERPKPPTVQKAEGFVFGISECRHLLENNQVASIILEAAINPRTIVHPLLDVCNKNEVPVVCLADLRKFSATNFGISTSCLGVKKTDTLTDLINKIKQISSCYKQFNNNNEHENCITQYEDNKNSNSDFEMASITDEKKDLSDITSTASCYTYLYRTDKKRVFVPTNIEEENTVKTQFMGQNFIKLPNEPEKTLKSKAYKKMMIKRISNNPNRVKKKT